MMVHTAPVRRLRAAMSITHNSGRSTTWHRYMVTVLGYRRLISLHASVHVCVHHCFDRNDRFVLKDGDYHEHMPLVIRINFNVYDVIDGSSHESTCRATASKTQKHGLPMNAEVKKRYAVIAFSTSLL